MVGRLGKRQLEIAASFAPSLMAFGGVAFCTLVYFTDWKVIAAKIPYYGGKFAGMKTEEDEQ